MSDLISQVQGALLSQDGEETGEITPVVDIYSNEAVSKRIDDRLKIDKPSRASFEAEWFKVILYVVGEHYTKRDKGQWRRRVMPKWHPRAITNKIAEKTNDLVAVLMRGRVPIHYFPATSDADDIATAEMEEVIRDIIYEESGVEYTEAQQAAWVATTGNAFRVTYYDDSPEHGEVEVQQWRCPACQEIISPKDAAKKICPVCQFDATKQTPTAAPMAAPVEEALSPEGMIPGEEPIPGDPAVPVAPSVPAPIAPAAPIPPMQFSEAIDEAGQPVMKTFNVGCLAADVCSPFEIRLDHTIPEIGNHRWYERLRLYDKDFAKQHWPDYAEEIDKIESPDPGTDDASTIFYLGALSRITSSFLGSGRGGVGGGTKDAPKVLVYEIVELASKEFPEGLRAVRIGTSDKLIVEKGPNPYEIGAGIRKGKKFLNIAHFGGEVVPGRFWRKTRLTDIIPLQNFRNVIESAIKITVHRAAGPSWLNPIGSQVAQFSGEPLQIIDYVPISFGGTSFAKPEMVPPALQSLNVLEGLLQKIDDSIERAAGTYFVQSGNAPANISAASALALLDENAQRSVAPLIREWAKGWKQWEQQAIEILRTFAVDERIRVAAGKNKKWAIEKFTKADLSGGVNVRVDYEGVIPRSQATQRATIIQLTQMGFINPLDPQTGTNVLAEFGLSGIRGSADKDWEEASKEWRRFIDDNIDPFVIPFVQNSAVHLQQHADDAKGDEFYELMKTNPAKAQRWIGHVQLTAADIQMKAMMAAGMNEGAPGAGGEDGGAGGGPGKKQAGAQAGAQGKNTSPLGSTPDILAPPEATPPAEAPVKG